jgi:hypothetical protein
MIALGVRISYELIFLFFQGWQQFWELWHARKQERQDPLPPLVSRGYDLVGAVVLVSRLGKERCKRISVLMYG